MFDRLKSILEKNNKELKDLKERKKGKWFSKNGIRDREKIILSNNELIEEYEEASKKYADAKKENNLRGMVMHRDSVCYYEEEVRNKTQGKLRDVFSACFFQIDKKIHNKIFNRGSKNGESLWEKHCYSVGKKYDNLTKYVFENSFIIIVLLTLSVLVGYANILPLKASIFAKAFFTSGMITNGLLAVNLIGNVISTLYNKRNYGKPFLKRYVPLLRGNYLENILNARYALKKSKEISDEFSSIELSDSMGLPSFMDVLQNDLSSQEQVNEIIEEKGHLDESTDLVDVEVALKNDSEKLQETVLEDAIPDIKNYGNIDLGHIGVLPEYHEENGELKYSTAISYLRRIDAANTDEKSFEDKMAAYEKLYTTFGKNKSRKNQEVADNKLSDYNQTLKLLSQYGRKIHEGTATSKEYNTYMGLLYHLGKDDDFITDYLSDEYDRYMADKEEYEKKLVKRI